MKFAVKILLLLFIAFLAMPTIVGTIQKKCDTSYFYSMSEEELAHKEVKANFSFHPELAFEDLTNVTSSLILSGEQLTYDKASAQIFIPPPEQV